MSNNFGPWGSLPPPPPPQKRPRDVARSRRLTIAVGLAIVVGLGAWGLSRLTPERHFDTDDWAFLASRLALVVLVAAGLLARGFNPGRAVRHIAIWICIIGVLLLGFSFRDELGMVGERLHAEFDPAYAQRMGAGEIALNRDSDGGFHVTGAVNGVPVRFLVDTGASEIVLSPADARRLGVDTAALTFRDRTETANGLGYGARYRADSLVVGPIPQEDVVMSINQAPMSTSLLGMAFLKRLASFEAKGSRLYLRAPP